MSESRPGVAADYKGPSWERLALGVILAAYASVCLNALCHDTIFGQDFPFHQMATFRFAAGTPRWFFMDPTSRPMLYLLGSLGVRFFGSVGGFYAASVVFIVLGALALGLIHDTLRRFIASPLMRVSAVALIAFLPTTLVTTVVYAADTLALFPFALTGWTLVRLLETQDPKERRQMALLCAFAMTLGDVAKATFFLLPVAGLVALGLAVRTRKLALPEAVRLGLMMAVLPFAVGFALNRAAHLAEADSPSRHTFDWRGTGEMTSSSLLLPKAADKVIFGAPVLFTSPVDPATRMPFLTENNGLSYPALLHLGIFTDVLNFAGNNVYRNRPRPAFQQRASEVSVAFGLLFSLAVAASVVALIISLLRGLRSPEALPRRSLSAWLLLALVWYVPLTVILPFVHHSYGWGYWLPRLVLPAVWVFGICLFERLGEWIPIDARKWAEPLVAGLVGLQCLLGIASVWY